MHRIIIFLACFSTLICTSAFAKEIDYRGCASIQEVIAIETQEIETTSVFEHDELAQLYVSRGESYLLNAQYDKAIEDFQNANSHIAYCQSNEDSMIVVFRSAFGEAICYDNLGMDSQTEKALEQINLIAAQLGCDDFIQQDSLQGVSTSSNIQSPIDLGKYSPYSQYSQSRVAPCKKSKEQEAQQKNRDSYDDVIGPNIAPDSNWCEEVVTGVGRSMDAIACLAPNYRVKVALIGVIEALLIRGIKCCQTGDFWKACAAPIVRKWREWKNNKENSLPPNQKNLPFYIGAEIA